MPKFIITEDIKIPLITLGVLTLLAFIPIIYIILLYVNAYYLYPFEKILRTINLDVSNYANLIGGIISLIGFYFSKRTSAKILWTVLSVFFFSAFVSYLTEDLKYERIPYFIPFIILALIVTTPLFLIGLVKGKKIEQ